MLLLAVQTAGLVHAADFDAHVKGDVCQVCQHHERASAPPPAVALVFVHVDRDGILRVNSPREAAADPLGLRPPSRAPPGISTHV